MALMPVNPRLKRGHMSALTLILFENLCRLFRPHVESIAKPKILAIQLFRFEIDDEAIANMTAGLKEASDKGLLPEITPETFAAIDKELRDPTPLTPEQLEVDAVEMVDDSTIRLVTAWIDCISLGISGDRNDLREIDAATVGDDMFPPIDPEMAALFDECCSQVDFTPDEARGILRAVRATLPAGKCMPDDAVELLALRRITVR